MGGYCIVGGAGKVGFPVGQDFEGRRLRLFVYLYTIKEMTRLRWLVDTRFKPTLGCLFLHPLLLTSMRDFDIGVADGARVRDENSGLCSWSAFGPLLWQ